MESNEQALREHVKTAMTAEDKMVLAMRLMMDKTFAALGEEEESDE